MKLDFFSKASPREVGWVDTFLLASSRQALRYRNEDDDHITPASQSCRWRQHGDVTNNRCAAWSYLADVCVTEYERTLNLVLSATSAQRCFLALSFNKPPVIMFLNVDYSSLMFMLSQLGPIICALVLKLQRQFCEQM